MKKNNYHILSYCRMWQTSTTHLLARVHGSAHSWSKYATDPPPTRPKRVSPTKNVPVASPFRIETNALNFLCANKTWRGHLPQRPSSMAITCISQSSVAGTKKNIYSVVFDVTVVFFVVSILIQMLKHNSKQKLLESLNNCWRTSTKHAVAAMQLCWCSQASSYSISKPSCIWSKQPKK